MDDVLRPALRHVAGDAVAVRHRMLAARVAGLANRPHWFGPTMRVVAVEAEELRPALAEAAALLETVRRVVDLEALALRHVGIDDVELQLVLSERFAGTKRVDVAAEAANRRQRDRRLHVAFVADAVAALRFEFSRHDDRRTHGRVVRAGERAPHVLRARAVAALASQAFGQRRRKHLRPPET